MLRLILILIFFNLPYFTFGQSIGLQGELARSTEGIVRNHRAIGISYLHSFKSNSIGQASITSGYSSFKNRDGHPFYGNRISINFSKLGPLKGNPQKGFFLGGGFGLDTYFVTRYISGSTNPVIFLQLHYQQSDLFNSRFGFFVNAKQKASIGLGVLTRAIDYYSRYAEPMLLIECNAGITYRLGKSKNPDLSYEN